MRHPLLRTLRANRAGTAAIEFGLVVPVFLASVIGVMEGGRILWTQNTLQRAVESAARCASIDTTTCGSNGQVKSYAATQAPDLNVTAANFVVSPQACGNQV